MSRTQVGANVKTANIPRSQFDLSHGLKTTFNASELVPILSLEVLPGDTINCRASLFGRMATPIKPILDNLFLETFFFFTPWRQVWPNFVKMMGEQTNPGDSIDFSVPTLASGTGGPSTIPVNSIGDYFGIPLNTDLAEINVSSLPFRCYNKIYNFWFRDENLMQAVVEHTGDTSDNYMTNYEVLSRRKRRDYITAGLPFPQKGPSVTIDLGGLAPVMTDAALDSSALIIGAPEFVAVPGNNVSLDSSGAQLTIGTEVAFGESVFADLSQATGFTINDFRESYQIQTLLERDARGGTRYPEILRSHFQVSDPSLLVHQRPLFLGGGTTRINITPVEQSQRSDTGETPQGNLAAYGTVSATGHGFTASFTEHGHILGIVNVRADLTYQQGLERYWSRQTRYDFYWPALAHLGEQAVRNSEVFVSNDKAIDDDTFAYMPRYDEYRFKQSQITGLFRSDAPASLDVWHLAQDFATLPALNEAFITDDVPMARVLAVQTEPDFLLDVYFKIKAARPLPLYGDPGLAGKF